MLAARLARESFTGPATILEGPGGFFQGFSAGEPLHLEALTARLGEDFHALATAIKPYPCCRFEHGAIDLAVELHRAGVKAADVKSIAIRIYRTDVLSYHHVPKNVVDAQFNVPYAVATALLRGKVGLSDFTDEAIRAPDVLALAGRIHVSEDAEFTAKYPNDYHVELKATLLDGRERMLLSTCPSGDPEAPQYAGAPERLLHEAQQKARMVLGECGFAHRADALIDCAKNLAEAPDLRALVGLLGAEGARRAFG